MWYLHQNLIVFKYRTFERFIKKSDKAAKKFEIISMLKKNGCTKHDYYDKLKLKYVWLCKKMDEPIIERSNLVFQERKHLLKREQLKYLVLQGQVKLILC